MSGIERPLPPGAGEREAARREFDAAWSRPENATVLARQRELAPGFAGPDEDAVRSHMMRAAVRSARTYAWGPQDQAAVLERMEADRQAARDAAVADMNETASFLSSMPFNPGVLRTVG